MVPDLQCARGKKRSAPLIGEVVQCKGARHACMQRRKTRTLERVLGSVSPPLSPSPLLPPSWICFVRSLPPAVEKLSTSRRS